jgi:hypothetical protein
VEQIDTMSPLWKVDSMSENLNRFQEIDLFAEVEMILPVIGLEVFFHDFTTLMRGKLLKAGATEEEFKAIKTVLTRMRVYFLETPFHSRKEEEQIIQDLDNLVENVEHLPEDLATQLRRVVTIIKLSQTISVLKQ